MVGRLGFICVLLLAGCAAPAAPPSQAEAADLSACTAQADAAYQAQNYDSLSRTSQNGLLFAPTPNHVFDAQRLGALHERDDEISDCVHDGTGNSGPANAAVPGSGIVIPTVSGPAS